MLIIFLQLTGGLCYLSNKLFFAAAECADCPGTKQKRRTSAWLVYLLGVIPWVAIFLMEHDWIAAAIESSGVPAMVLGLIPSAKKDAGSPLSRGLDILSRIMIASGLILSLWDFGGITTANQIIELGIAAGFLFGTYGLARGKTAGYYWLLLGNVSAALLMQRQGYYILAAQQLLSTLFVRDALLSRRKKRKGETP